jgi:hypothetical protein
MPMRSQPPDRWRLSAAETLLAKATAGGPNSIEGQNPKERRMTDVPVVVVPALSGDVDHGRFARRGGPGMGLARHLVGDAAVACVLQVRQTERRACRAGTSQGALWPALDRCEGRQHGGPGLRGSPLVRKVRWTNTRRRLAASGAWSP